MKLKYLVNKKSIDLSLAFCALKFAAKKVFLLPVANAAPENSQRLALFLL